ncbi:tRNA (adenosine(37)-N6)-threonylcarbamoyltransferase complex ATPase subunit type 1 TsaE [Undibacterium oligocarboniphilum]|uniref:tRNA threonylcarbamoyladenosine biosynthesis protein TsaE n=1 Tax=Undibacterium oligocarboniphilum TaxID=666702 RepID=A0A850QIV0_9BURK|nr:tRNA (adenosine(37)-N6)-threonylcarbamoyltransferase complex ATPase subunit type 1 TsaE [Undibacterium oligocarboniphilum]MBC3871604.1 tRNA (adenosine(37)-N6)-threonylcarbamoyltransferase complex ATPase subunit type 1 TsaE [Undibacterium oligocarboniphilum]NVO79037.1 tRNA (adenosine(37)-N6)-threonylcarbamoyltransferase complex ATPase subunit type 1 TsaE [Undibacterium oligocarboniphilum]
MSHYKTTLHDEAATQALGKSLAHTLVPGLSIFLHGDLGTGKTALTRALIHAAGHPGHVKSPTYTLAEPYDILLRGQPATIMHFDLYRMSTPEEFLDAGFREEFNASNICIVEWPEKAEDVLPEPDLNVYLRVAGDGREVELHALSAKGIACLASLQFVPNL